MIGPICGQLIYGISNEKYKSVAATNPTKDVFQIFRKKSGAAKYIAEQSCREQGVLKNIDCPEYSGSPD